MIPVNVTTSCQDLYIDPHVSNTFAVLTINNLYYVAWFSLSAGSQLKKTATLSIVLPTFPGNRER